MHGRQEWVADMEYAGEEGSRRTDTTTVDGGRSDELVA